MAKNPLTLAPVELMLMKAVWRRGAATVQEVTDAVAPERKLAYSTVLTMLRSLEDKGFLTHDQEDRRYVYRPVVNEDDVGKSMLKDMLDRVFDGSKELLLTRLFELGRVDDEELRLIRRKLASIKGKRKGGRKRS